MPGRVAILGGGMGALAAAYDLVRDPEEAKAWDITIYQRGSLLGGKGASGRNLAKNARIEEHGLHILMGFYEGVFSILRECYEELYASGDIPEPPSGAPWWEGVLFPVDEIAMEEALPGGGWDPEPWRVHFPPNSRAPGDSDRLPSLMQLFDQLSSWYLELEGPSGGPPSMLNAAIGVARRELDKLREASAALRAVDDALDDVIEGALETFADAVHAFNSVRYKLTKGMIESSAEDRRAFIAAHLAGIHLVGMLRDGLLRPPYDTSILDTLDYKEWIKKHSIKACPPHLSYESAPVNAVYDLVFSRAHGFAAGTALFDVLHVLFDYRGHILYKMVGGMGDVVFAPLYLVLKKRGVKFRFFHDVTGLHLNDQGTCVDRVSMLLEAKRPASPEDYDPLVSIDGRPCWPTEPAPSPGGPALFEPERVEIRRGEHFDAVVLAISVGGLAPICGELSAKNPRFAKALESARTTRTQAIQVWTKPDAAGLGWPYPHAILGSYERPLNSWSDMSQVIERESWGGDPPGNISYFCDALEDDVPSDQATESVKKGAISWLNAHVHKLWPLAAKPGAMKWDVLRDPEEREGELRFDAQYVRANVDGSDRYVIAAPGSMESRLAADESGFENLVLAGDWTRTRINAGSVEAAAQSGRNAAEALRSGIDSIATEGAYVEHDGDFAFRHPILMEGLTAHAFVIRCDPERLARLCHRYFPHDCHHAVRITPVGPYALVMHADVEKVRSLDARDAHRGALKERDFGIWIPVLIEDDSGPRLAWFLPYLYVDSPASVSLGREIYGFPKALGAFSPFDLEGSGKVVSVDAVVLPTYGREVVAAPRRVIEVRGESLAEPPPSFRTVEDAKAWLGYEGKPNAGDGPDEPARDFLASVLGTNRFVFLKQFRDAGQSAKACYRAILEAPAAVRRFSGGGLCEGSFEVFFPPYASLQIARALGTEERAPVELAFFARFDFEIGLGRVLWRDP